MTTAEVTLLELTKQSILADPDFTMQSYSHCLANHICRAAGHKPYGEFIDQGSEIHVKDRALELISFADKSFFSCASIGEDKEEVFRRIDQFVAENYTPEAEPELKPELVEA